MWPWTDNGGAWILKDSRLIEDEKTEGERDGETTLTSSSKLSRGVRGMVSLRGLRASHSERAGVDGADDPVGESGQKVIEVRPPREIAFASFSFVGVGIWVICTVEGRLGVTSMCRERFIGEGSLIFGVLISEYK